LKRSNRLVLLIGIFLALVAFVLIVLMFSNNSGGGTGIRATPSPSVTNVVVAVRDIDLGARIQAEDVGLKEIAVEDRPDTAFGDTSLVIGQIARAKVTAGQLVTSTVLNSSGQISDIEVPAGFVAMAVQVDQVTGVGTIIKPGDFVDVVTGFTTNENVKVVVPDLAPSPGTYNYQAYPPEQYNETTVKALSQGLQVLGTLLPPPPDNTEPAPSESPSSGTNTTLNGQQQIVILAVPAQDAEVIKFAQIDGNISLVLRSASDCTTKPADGLTYCPVVATTGITLRRLVDDRGVLPPQVVQVIQPTPLPGTVPSPSPKR
jgi:pilus assembly protein CpaB